MATKSRQADSLRKILEAQHHDPFSFLGLHQDGAFSVLRVFLPYAKRVRVKTGQGWQDMQRAHPDGLYLWNGPEAPPRPVLLEIEQDGHIDERHDAYSFPPIATAHDLHLLGEGRLRRAYTMLGARIREVEGVTGVHFCVWAPNAERVSVVGDFNRWDGRLHPMRAMGASGVWEIFIPGLEADSLYKFELRSRHTGQILVKTDPYGRAFELRPGTAARVIRESGHTWNDVAWMQQRAQVDWLHAPMHVYELHAGSWQRGEQGRFLNFRELAARLIPYITDMHFTHIELMPVSEHPLDESWGYQTTGYFGLTSRFGTPDDFRFFVDACHQAGIGVLLDWVPAHFPKDDWALARFDGTALYEHEDPRLGEHQDWGTYIFNYGRNEVCNFLLANASYWLEEFHIDGLRVDAVASMLYLDYSRKAGEWLPNRHGGRENLEAIEFLKALNIMVHEHFPGALTLAEESTAWPMVSRPVHLGGLGFSMKWNMGWMNDTLAYMKQDPVHRRYHHNLLTFGQLYAYTENFVLPFSHDEVVHGKHSLLDKMPGDAWQRFANLRLLLLYQMTWPGKKLNFMGNEFGQGREWSVGSSLDWHLLETGWHQGIQQIMRDLGRLYVGTPALYERDFSREGFSWLECQDAAHSLLAYQRHAHDGSTVVVLLNFTPVPRKGYRTGLPGPGHYRELLNSDATCYGGSNLGNGSGIEAESRPCMGCTHSALVTLPPLGGIILQATG